jgi:hypothetical protein
MRGDVLALSDGSNLIALAFSVTILMSKLGIYVDESGNFGDFNDSARYCMVALVFCEEDHMDCDARRAYMEAIFRLGADPESMVFHTAPLIRQEEQFSAMSRNMRGKIFYQMLSFVRKSKLRFRCFAVDTRYVSTKDQIVHNLRNEIAEFVTANSQWFSKCNELKLYYDAGQKEVARILDVLNEVCTCKVSSVPGVRQQNEIFLQVADFLCTIKLMGIRLAAGISFNLSEKKFFGTPRDFKRNVYRKIEDKEI